MITLRRRARTVLIRRLRISGGAVNTQVSQDRTENEQGLLMLVFGLVLLGAVGMLLMLG